jgi:chromosome partitioning protein
MTPARANIPERYREFPEGAVPGGACLEDVVTVEEAARYLKLHPKTIQRWCREGRVPSLRVGSRYRIRQRDLDRVAVAEQPERLPEPASSTFVAPAASDSPPPARRTGPARIIAVCNQKGGVGKTTTTQALGAALADLGESVLLVDLDPQGSLTASLGLRPAALECTVYTLMCEMMAADEQPDTAKAVVGIGDRLSLLPSNINLSAAEVSLPNQVRREYVLTEVLAPVRNAFDWMLIDCPPSLSLLTINALTAADECIVPVTPEPLVTVGVGLLFQTIARVRRTKLNPDLVVAGVVITKLDARPALTRGVIADLRTTLGDRVPILGEVRASIRVQEASASGVPLTRYRPAADAAASYRQIAEVLHARQHSK